MEEGSISTHINVDKLLWVTGEMGRKKISAIYYKVYHTQALALSNPRYCSEQWYSKIKEIQKY